jgi:hypothetical protein
LSERTITCPKCGFAQEPSIECIRCGIVFRKLKKRMNTVSDTSSHLPTTKHKSSPKKPRISFRAFRISILLIILFFVGLNAWLTKLRATDWEQPLRVVLYPINGDGSSASSEYITSLRQYTFGPIEHFIEEASEHHNLTLSHPVIITLATEIDEIPPKPAAGGNVLRIIWWSIHLRYWAYSVDTYDGPSADIQIFVLYHEAKKRRQLDSSLGLEKGLIGVVNAFASKKMEGNNNVVIAHELLHTLGATDKYDPVTQQPVYPDGYAAPDQQPLYPQEQAEVMGGRIPLSDTKAEMPGSLQNTVIGIKTAREINWIK